MPLDTTEISKLYTFQCNLVGDFIKIETGNSGKLYLSFANVEVFVNKLEECSGTNCEGYRGYQTKTRAGNTCQRWDVQTPNSHSDYTPSTRPSKGLASNYCRNPGGGVSIWCFITSGDENGGVWGYCDPLLSDLQTKDFFDQEQSGIVYRGRQSVTKAGSQCQRWDEQSPNTHTATPALPATAATAFNNYCRQAGASPSAPDALWCYQ